MEIERTTYRKSLFRVHTMLPAEHGAWIFLFSPLVIGLALGGTITFASALLVTAALAAFLVRQPVTILVKVFSGRRPRSDLGAAIFWLVIYGLVGLLGLAGLLVRGDAFILLLAIPAIPVFGWHLWLVIRRAERHAMLVEIVASGVLALAAPAAFWVGKGEYDLTGWLLWGLSWLQTAGTIVYTYLRLKQRRLREIPETKESIRMGVPALVFNTGLFILVILLAVFSIVPIWLPAAYSIQALEVVWGLFHPAVLARPGAIGTRQLVVSLLFTALFVIAWIF